MKKMKIEKNEKTIADTIITFRENSFEKHWLKVSKKLEERVLKSTTEIETQSIAICDFEMLCRAYAKWEFIEREKNLNIFEWFEGVE